MILNYIWISFFLLAFFIALFRFFFLGDLEIFSNLSKAVFEMSKTGFEISLWLTGILSFWLGIMRIGEKGGLVNILSRLVGPFFAKLFPDIPKNHPVAGTMMMNFAANMLGMDNAAAPLGLKAMEGLQELNPTKDTASNAQIMFVVLHASSLVVVPVTIIAYRVQAGAANPADIYIPLLIATFCSALGGLIAVSFFQKVNLFNKVVLFYLGGLILFIVGLILYFQTLTSDQINTYSTAASNLILFSIIAAFIGIGLKKKVNVFEAFIEGAKEGFEIVIKIIPYLVAMLVAIGVFRECGALDLIVNGLGSLFAWMGLNTDFVPALPTAFMKPLSGSGARGMMFEAMKTYGADSFVGRLVCILQGSTETTFYVVALYFGSVNVRKTRYTVTCALIADLCGLVGSILVAYFFFH